VGESRALRIWGLITDRAGSEPVSLRSLCAACVAAVDVDGAMVRLASDLGRQLPMHATDEIARMLDDAQFTLGEGPGAAAWDGREMVLTADIASADSAARWPMFAAAAAAAGAGAVFAFPLQVGAIRIGVLEMYRVRPGRLSAEQLADAVAFAMAALTVILGQASTDTDDGPGAGQDWPVDGLVAGRAEVYQATGMVAAQLDGGLEEALVRLRAHAFAHGMGVTEVARRVVARQLRFSSEVE
jgi:hypothetical protein